MNAYNYTRKEFVKGSEDLQNNEVWTTFVVAMGWDVHDKMLITGIKTIRWNFDPYDDVYEPANLYLEGWKERSWSIGDLSRMTHDFAKFILEKYNIVDHESVLFQEFVDQTKY